MEQKLHPKNSYFVRQGYCFWTKKMLPGYTVKLDVGWLSGCYSMDVLIQVRPIGQSSLCMQPRRIYTLLNLHNSS